MIYSRWGSGIRITGYCGKHKAPGFASPMMLVRADQVADRQECYYFAFTLRADGGINEVSEAIDASPEIKLSETALKAAIEQAM